MLNVHLAQKYFSNNIKSITLVLQLMEKFMARKKKFVRPRYKMEIKAEARKLFVEKNMSFIKISELFQGRPTPQIIAVWAKKSKPTWQEERIKNEQRYYERISPNVVAQNLYEKIATILARENFNSQDADALAKLHKTLETIINPSYQIPIMYQVLKEFIDFMKSNYPKLITDNLINSIRHFKNELRERLTKGGLNVGQK
jgi:hypothetical protein